MTAPTRILVIDDDRAFRLSTAAILQGDGHETDVAANGEEGVQKLRDRRFDLLLLDLRMPGINGLALLEALRVWGHDIPILMISGFGTVDTAVRALHTGADDFLTKPVEPDVLVARVQELLGRRPNAGGESNPGSIVGRSPSMQALFERIRRVSPVAV